MCLYAVLLMDQRKPINKMLLERIRFSWLPTISFLGKKEVGR